MASRYTDCWWRTTVSTHGTAKPGRTPGAWCAEDAYHQSTMCSAATRAWILVVKEAAAALTVAGRQMATARATATSRTTVRRTAARTQTIATERHYRVVLKAGGKLRIGGGKDRVGLTRNRHEKRTRNVYDFLVVECIVLSSNICAKNTSLVKNAS